MSLLLLLLCRLLCGSEVSTDGCLTPLISLENEWKTEEIKSEICGGGGHRLSWQFDSVSMFSRGKI